MDRLLPGGTMIGGAKSGAPLMACVGTFSSPLRDVLHVDLAKAG